MAYRLFSRLPKPRLILAGSLGAGITAAGAAGRTEDPIYETEAEKQFHTSSLHPVPQGWTGRVWQIRDNYPTVDQVRGYGGKQPYLPDPGLPPSSPNPLDDAPWTKIDFKKNPEYFCQVIKEYCLEGNVNNDFVVQNNRIRQWYHAPWMHYGPNGREPLNGFTSELATKPGVIAANQKRYIQNWACGFYNATGATVFGEVWKDPNNPNWNKDLMFPLGTCVFKILLTEATEKEISTLTGSPTMDAVIAPSPADPKVRPDPTRRNPFPTPLRLLQVDFAVRDERALTGWVFGTFMYDGRRSEKNPWDRLIPVGIMWGNSPEVTQEAYENGKRPTEQWINKEATDLMTFLGGTKPFSGWNTRMNGPVDNFVSACSSCHSLAQQSGESSIVPVPPQVEYPKGSGNWVPAPGSDNTIMQWFRNVPSGQSWTPGAKSADYSLQMMIGWHNYEKWKDTQRNPIARFSRGVKFAWDGVPKDQRPGSEEKRSGRGVQFD